MAANLKLTGHARFSLSQVSIWSRAHRKHLERRRQNLDGDGINLLSITFRTGVRFDISHTSLRRG